MSSRELGGNPAASDEVSMIGRYAPDGVDLCGDPAALQMFARRLTTPTATGSCRLCVPTTFPPDPYDGFLASIEISESVGLVQIELEGDVLAIRGAADMLGILAENVVFLAEEAVMSEPGKGLNHLHVEYHSDHFFLDPSAIPLVVSVEVN